MMKNFDATEDIINEVQVMSQVNHPNVLKMIKHGVGKCVKPNGDQPARVTDVLYVAIELAQDLTLFDYIIDQEPFAEGTALVFYE